MPCMGPTKADAEYITDLIIDTLYERIKKAVEDEASHYQILNAVEESLKKTSIYHGPKYEYARYKYTLFGFLAGLIPEKTITQMYLDEKNYYEISILDEHAFAALSKNRLRNLIVELLFNFDCEDF
jgi:VIT1/CCC1 family predicted Fe2+/Mn2+ transporter